MSISENSVIENIKFKSFDFKSIKDINTYRKEKVTQQATIFVTFIHTHIKIVGDNIIYYYNETKKLWTKIDDEQYKSYVYDFFYRSGVKIRDILKSEECEDFDKKVIEGFDSLIDKFDQKTYILNIIDRASSKLYDVNFITKLNTSHAYFPIGDGKKINLKTLEVTDRTYEDMFTYFTDVKFVDKTPNADLFFSQIQPKEENREFVRKVLGYSLTGETLARKFFVWYGFGSNGKSKVFNVMAKLLNSQYVQCDSSIFMKANKNGGAATPELMALMGCRCGVYSEGSTSDEIKMNLGGLKQISGEDIITGRPLYCKQVQFKPYVKLHMLTNFVPPLNGEKAIIERLNYIFMDSTFVDNPNIKNKNEFKKDDEFSAKLENEYLSEMFTWIVKGSKMYYDNGILEMPDEFKIRTTSILSGEDSIKSYTDRFLKITNDEKDYINKSTFWETYRKFAMTIHNVVSQEVHFLTDYNI
jgi:P4 family phage/plasmid primase-like protien